MLELLLHLEGSCVEYADRVILARRNKEGLVGRETHAGNLIIMSLLDLVDEFARAEVP